MNSKPDIIFCDLDGVLVDLHSSLLKRMNCVMNNYLLYNNEIQNLILTIQKQIGRNYFITSDMHYNTASLNIQNFAKFIMSNNINFWQNLNWTKDGQQLWDAIRNKNVYILSSPLDEDSKIGKTLWVTNNLKLAKHKILFSHNKYLYASNKTLLIDDMLKNIVQFKQNSGIGIIHITADLTIKILQNLQICP